MDPVGILKYVGIATGSMMTIYYAFSLVSATVANWTLFRTLPRELEKQTKLLERICFALEKR